MTQLSKNERGTLSYNLKNKIEILVSYIRIVIFIITIRNSIVYPSIIKIEKRMLPKLIKVCLVLGMAGCRFGTSIAREDEQDLHSRDDTLALLDLELKTVLESEIMVSLFLDYAHFLHMFISVFWITSKPQAYPLHFHSTKKI